MLRQTVTLFQAQAQQQETSLELELQSGTRANEQYIISADPFQLEQVLVNIIKNALESLRQGGRIRVALAKRSRRLIIADNGPGLSPEAAEQIFTPFFTSKPNGQGIGLTLVRDILMNHNYRFSLSTDQDGWTRFVIHF